MKRLLLPAIVMLFALSGGSVNAKVRTSAEVLAIAEKHFTTQKAATRAGSSKIVKTISASEIFPQTRAKNRNSGEPFYVLVASNGSHVIVSGDDQMPQLIGYSDYKFDKNQVNEGLKMLLSAYCSAYDDIQATGVSKLETAPQGYASTAFPTEIAPLLNGIAYDQVEPYNGMSPILSNGKRGYTGCVTTAMAMVMRYHQYPERAKGRGVGAINDIDLSEHPLLWNKMLKTYAEDNVTNPKENRDAVAWLMRSCGAALETKYMLGSSGSGENMIAPVFANNFGYDQGVVNVSREDKTYEQWDNLIKTELVAKRPIVYLATQATQAVGHAVVIDGYDSRGMYYVNWGWTTAGNGYYSINTLGSNYITGHGAVIGIQKPTGAPYVSKFVKATLGMKIIPTTVARTGTFELVENWDYLNRGDTFTGDIALVLFKDGKFVTTVGTPERFENILRNDGITIGFKGVTIPGSVENGRYKLYLASKATTETNWQPFDMDLQDIPYYYVDITSSQIVLTSPVSISTPKLLSFEPKSKLYFREYVDFKMKMQYEGTEVDAFIKVVMTSRATNKVIELNLSRNVMTSGTYEMQFSKLIQYEPGDYKVEVQFSKSGGIYVPLEGTDAIKDLTVYTENFERFDYFVLASSVRMEKNTITNKDKPRLILELKNVGAKDIDGAVLSLTTDGGGFSNLDQTPLSIKKDETKKIVLESTSIFEDADDYVCRVQIKYPSGGTFESSIIRNANGKFPFGVRTLKSGK